LVTAKNQELAKILKDWNIKLAVKLTFVVLNVQREPLRVTGRRLPLSKILLRDQNQKADKFVGNTDGKYMVLYNYPRGLEFLLQRTCSVYRSQAFK